MKKLFIILNCIFIFNARFLFSQTSSSSYQILNKISISGDGGWDYLVADDEKGRLFVSHSTMVQVIDLKERKLIGTIPDTKGVHGIALAKDLNKGFISNGKDSSVTVFNLQTLDFIEKVYVTGRNPDAILYDSFSHRIFTFNGGGKNSTVIDAKTDKVLGTIDLNGKPEFSVSDGKGKIYVNIEDKSVVKEINPITLKVEHEWNLSPGEGPSGLAMDIENQILFVVCDNKLMVILDALTGKKIVTLPIGERVDGVAFDPVLKRAYSSNGDGTLTVVQENDNKTFKMLENITTQKSARTIAIDKSTHHLFLPAAEFGPMPEPTNDIQHPRPSIKPGTFVVLEIGLLN